MIVVDAFEVILQYVFEINICYFFMIALFLLQFLLLFFYSFHDNIIYQQEGDCVNIDVTAPGATLALGMIYFRSNNKAIAEWMVAPSTPYLLDQVCCALRVKLCLYSILSRENLWRLT